MVGQSWHGVGAPPGAPRVYTPRNNSRVEQDAFKRAEQQLRNIEADNAATRSYELQQLELVAAFMKLEANEERQKAQLTARAHKKQDREAQRRHRREETKYHDRSPRLAERARQPSSSLPHDPPVDVVRQQVHSARRMQRADLDAQLLARKEALAHAAEVEDRTNAELVSADLAAVARTLASRDGRTLEQKSGIQAEWERQRALTHMQKGTSAAMAQPGCRAVPKQKPAGEWAIIP